MSTTADLFAHRPHSSAEDVQALTLGAGFIAFGLLLLKAAGLVVGGIAGVALTLSYLTDVNVGILFFLLNLPFYIFGLRTLGWTFTLKSLVVAALLAAFSLLLPKVVSLGRIDPLFAAIFGGSMIGMGVLALTRHRASVGGIGVLIAYLHKRHGIATGLSQLLTDTAIILAGLIAIDLRHLVLSIIGAGALSLVLFSNHRPGRYTG